MSLLRWFGIGGTGSAPASAQADTEAEPHGADAVASSVDDDADTSAGTMSEGLSYAAKRRVPVVLTSRTGAGRIASPIGDLATPEYIAGEDLPPLKARILLALALTRTHSPNEIQRIFREY